MDDKINAVVIGYGNIGKHVVQSLEESPDFQIAGIIRRDVSNVPEEIAKYNIADSVSKLKGVDVAFITTPTRSVQKHAVECLNLGINTVDSFDIHEKILDHKTSLHKYAKENNAVSVISAGWDPGSDSIVRALLEAVAPKGVTYTNFGPGMSMGHTVAVKAIAGVKDALSMTIPIGTGVHRRMVYIELEQGYDFDAVASAIKADDYFVKDDTHVVLVENVDMLKDMGHGVLMERKGVSGSTHNQVFKFDMRINNPALTAEVLVAAARASLRQNPGAYTMIEIPVVDLLPGDKSKWIGRLV